MTLFAALMWPLLAFRVYFARILVIVAMSGQVDVDSHVRDPTMDCIICIIAADDLVWNVSFGILSTGKPERYGLRGQLTFGLSNWNCLTRLSMNASCVRWQEMCPSLWSVYVNFIPRK